MEKSKCMRWWIVEDALRDRKGHWLEYLQTFQRGLMAEGDEVRFFASKECAPDVASLFDAEAVLPPSIWARMGDGALKWRRLLRIPAHGLATYRAVSKLLAGRSTLHAPSFAPPACRALPDLIFVPTVLVHHLVGWVPLIKQKLRRFPGCILLFFPNAPVFLDRQGSAHVASDPTARLFVLLIKALFKEVSCGKVVLGAETEPMAKALTEVTGVRFTYLPHPVELSAKHPPATRHPSPATPDNPIVFGCYGAARHEKGSDILQRAIALVLEKRPEMSARFVFQWMEDFADEKGNVIRLDPEVAVHPKVQVIREHFNEGGYERQLAATDVMLLPYRNPYRLRVSRVVIEGMILGIPVIVTRGTTLWDHASRYGCAIPCDEDSPESLAVEILSVFDRLQGMSEEARACRSEASRHFSVAEFRRQLLSKN